MDENALVNKLMEVLSEPLYASFLMAATKLDDDVKRKLVPVEFGNIIDLSKRFGNLVSESKSLTEKTRGQPARTELDAVDLPPFLKHALISIMWNELP
jgi:hypothetical protein